LTFNLQVETLGLSNPIERSEGRLKSLFWPAVKSGADVDYLGTQGYWVCTFVAVISFLFLLHSPVLAIILLLFFYLGGVGVRERDVYAAAIVFAFYVIDTFISTVFLFFSSPWGLIVVRFFITALLFANIRATWIASHWQVGSEQAALPPRMSETLADKFADQWPAKIWPKARIPYYIFGLLMLFLTTLGLARMLGRLIVRWLAR
jgi:hypothetical protein